jgi:hypothetical protein
MTAAHVASPSGLSIVPLLGKVATQTCVSIGNLVTASPTVIFWGRVETALTYSFSSLLFQKNL